MKLVIENLELNNAKTHHVHHMIQYANNLTLILMKHEKSEKITEKFSGHTFKITYISAAYGPKVANLVSNGC